MMTYWRYVGQGQSWDSAFEAAFGETLRSSNTHFETLRHDRRSLGGQSSTLGLVKRTTFLAQHVRSALRYFWRTSQKKAREKLSRAF
ncbi:hypothetical protein OEZ49_13800 [Ruegeria sp. WL0004]|uniref:Uncharacterized protein n=1 Tax=Ruegeria marisflavi TaxID=2984152 RepID=A0ABT2WSI3_9RHOB|nr:hypothetical protein [Ruegeria sp. WL0004]MCU9838847.1 hypothetical protein [Ruegeria sp. WL0004]